ncbi:oxygen-independent coproporphyrinogen III oxidase [Octadecabacter antarcticus 307]|uniref:Heme chaperone HemW n=1 Tax=Octadecabacter antarcticus 307 TaxID=391626 RepID=M9RJX3_9RHOB|nr:radical SAM family heme chaperone HemW [Octadecabacter antarcticus]AGI70140.1 oxygen-independent coproporphyrinogen III oxidase [Octadecabacter antarcticus 307]
MSDCLETGGFGLYLHWPFCQAKCPYCDFNSHVVASVDQTRWAAAFEKEIDRVAELTSDRVLNSVFFGGGTPSLMDVETVDRILARVQKRWRLANDLEVTLEANPTSIEAQRFTGYRDVGVNRVSVGVQALNDTDLRALGRLHSADEALAAVEIARTTFDRVSFDLIYARQNQTVGEWQSELTRALELEPDHLSLYQLTVEDGTSFGDRFKRGLLRGLPNEDLGADLWDVTQNACVKAGLPAYEVSNHAKRGQESRHNLIYWRSGDWAGIGPGAHGRLTLDGIRHETVCVKSPGGWIAQVESGALGLDVGTALVKADILEERVIMGLRVVDGIEMPAEWIANKLNKINDLVDLGHLKNIKSKLNVTVQGRPVLNAVISHLLTD